MTNSSASEREAALRAALQELIASWELRADELERAGHREGGHDESAWCGEAKGLRDTAVAARALLAREASGPSVGEPPSAPSEDDGAYPWEPESVIYGLIWWEAQRAQYIVPIMESSGWRLCEYEGTGPFRPIGPFADTLEGAIVGAAKEANWNGGRIGASRAGADAPSGAGEERPSGLIK